MQTNDTNAPSQRAGTRRAAIALVGMKEERAANVLGRLSDPEVRDLTDEIVKLSAVHGTEVEAVLTLLAGSLDATLTIPAPGAEFAQDVLTRAFGEERGNAVLADVTRPAPFAWLSEADPDISAAVLAGETPPAVALALSHLDHKAAAQLLRRLPEKLRMQVAQRIAELDSVNAQSVLTVDEALREKVGEAVRAPVRKVDGATVLAGILNASSKEDEKSVLTELSDSKPELADAVKAMLFTFEDLLRLEPRALQRVLGATEVKDLALALKNVDDAFKDRVFANVSERTREALEEELDLLSSVRASDVHDARRRVVATVRSLEEEGAITIERADEEVA